MKTAFHTNSFFQVIGAVVLGMLLGHVAPDLAVRMKPLGDGFVQLIKMVVAPVIFCTVVSGIGGMRDLKKLGRVGGKAIVYFEAVSALALVLGLVGAHILQPGSGFHVNPASLDASALAPYAVPAAGEGITGFFLQMIPYTLVDAFVRGEILQVLVLAILFGAALSAAGARGQVVSALIEQVAGVFFGIVHIISKAAPLAAFGAVAFTIGRYGIVSVEPLFKLIAALYVTSVVFILLVLGAVARASGFSVLRFVVHIKEELLIVLCTSSSLVVLPQLMEKLERLGCAKSVVGLVVPAGYSFNLCGTKIYIMMTAIFIAQALSIDLTWTQQLTLLGVAILTSKGASGVAGSGFITLAATLAVVPEIPVAGMVLVLGIERLLKCRSLTNVVGNGVACLAIAAWAGELDRSSLQPVGGHA